MYEEPERCETLKSISSSFYKSREWKRCRADYLNAHPFCENCLRKGRYTPATHVHHIIFLNRENVENPAIALSFDNLMAVCHNCHNEIHFKNETTRRFTVGSDGHISPLFDDDTKTR